MLCVFKNEIAGPFVLFREPAITSHESSHIGGTMYKCIVRSSLIEVFLVKVRWEGFDDNVSWYLVTPP
jgi:hypothetical protein